MKKYMVIFAFSYILASCGSFSRFVGKVTGFSRICVDGVSYLQFTSGASVEYTMEGKVKNCK